MSLEQKIEHLLWGRYELGIIDNSIDELIAGEPMKLHVVKHDYKDRWFADPFVLEVTESEIILLVEEYYYPEKKGRLAMLTIDKSSLRIVGNTTILNIPTHLSFPLIRRNGDEIFVIPENGELGRLVRYRLDRESCQLIADSNLIDKSLADAVDVNIDGENYLFCTECPGHSGATLSIFKKQSEEYKPYKIYDFKSDKIARMAGDFFTHNGKLYRPCQDCNNRYGEAVLIQEVIKDGHDFNFNTVSRYNSPSKRWNLGLHTLNSFKGVIVVDLLGYTVYPRFTKLLGYTLGAIRRLKKFK